MRLLELSGTKLSMPDLTPKVCIIKLLLSLLTNTYTIIII